MIDRIEIYGFQSHSDSKFHFTPGINAIIGSSDSGKSAILRALNWILTNRPIGDSFIKHGDDNCVVRVGIGDKTIVRSKNRKTINKYEVHQSGCEPIVFKAFGQDVPEDIIDLLNFDSVNLQKQFDSHFLLSDSSSEVSKVFNRVVNIDVIDTTISNIEKMKKECNLNIKSVTSDIGDLENKKSVYGFIDSMSQSMQTIDESIFEYDELCAKCEMLSYLNDKLLLLDNEINKYNDILRCEDIISDTYLVCTEVDKIKKSISSLESLNIAYVECNKYITNVVSIGDIDDYIMHASDLINNLSNMIKYIGLLGQLKCVDDEITGYEFIIEQLESEIGNIMSEGVICPIFDIECRGKK